MAIIEFHSRRKKNVQIHDAGKRPCAIDSWRPSCTWWQNPLLRPGLRPEGQLKEVFTIFVDPDRCEVLRCDRR